MKVLTSIAFYTFLVLQIYAFPRPEEHPISSIEIKKSVDKDVPASPNVPVDSQIHATLALLQKSPTYYQDMFNIPIAALQAVGNFLTGSYITNNFTSIRPTLVNKNVQTLLLKSSLVSQEADNLPLTETHGDASTAVVSQSDIHQQTKPGIMLLRIPTMQDILNIPISTLQAVSHFLDTNYGTPISTNATVTKPAAVTKDKQVIEEIQLSPIFKSSLVSDVQVETSSQSTISAAAPVTPGGVQIWQQPQQSNLTYYQDIFNIPIALLQAISNFLSNAYINRNTAVVTPSQKLPEKNTPISQASVKSLKPDMWIEAQSTSNSIYKNPVKSVQASHGPLKESPQLGQLKKRTQIMSYRRQQRRFFR